jgi:chaperonin GroES
LNPPPQTLSTPLLRRGFSAKTTNHTTNNMANIKPLGQRVLVKRLEADAISAGGIVLPDTAKEKPQEAEVLSLGTGGKDDKGVLIEFTVKVGNKVLISKYGGTEVKLDGEEVLIINEADILAIVG